MGAHGTPGHDDAARAAEEHHADLWAELTLRSSALIRAVAEDDDAEAAGRDLAGYVDDVVVPHLESEERDVYAAARAAGQAALVDGLELDHRALLRQAEALRHAPSALEAALAARAFLLLFALRMEKEERILLPLLEKVGESR